MKQVHINLTEQQVKEMRAITREYGIRPSEIIRRALDQFIDARKERLQRERAFTNDPGRPASSD